ncbi:hypothetical protein DL240_11950 [Lujinxingia litoralis]|uniref:Protein BatD n=1 Tax=Lujinxingia litoralis TaxID=2211119 RepID=A0A328C3G2_9DELT|nr:hypothetical protein [Lujinxingia litoralis]RAL21564.1 hypothetical protein DL240_11950 [Lujinxingia litoralis]
MSNPGLTPPRGRARTRYAGPLCALLLAASPAALAQPVPEAPAGNVVAETEAPAPPATEDLELVHHELTLPPELKVGEEVALRVEVRHRPDLRLTVRPDAEGSRWERVSLDSETRDEGGFKITTFDLAYAVFRPGQTRSPEVVIRALGSDGEPQELRVPGSPVHVAPISANDAGLLGARGARALLISDATPYLVGGAALGLVLMGAAGALLARRRRRALLPETPRLPAPEEALQKLEHLARSSLLDDGEFMAYYVRLSETIRTYLGRRWDFPGTELTTSEIVERLSQRAELPADLEAGDIARWLRACDRVKFAGHVPAGAEARQHLQSAFHLVERTRQAVEPPVETPAEAPAPAPQAPEPSQSALSDDSAPEDA